MALLFHDISHLYIIKRLRDLGIKDTGDIKDYPPIKELLSNGWQTMKP